MRCLTRHEICWFPRALYWPFVRRQASQSFLPKGEKGSLMVELPPHPRNGGCFLVFGPILESYPTDPTYEAGKFRIQLSRSIWGGGKGRDPVNSAQKQIWSVLRACGTSRRPSLLEQVVGRAWTGGWCCLFLCLRPVGSDLIFLSSRSLQQLLADSSSAVPPTPSLLPSLLPLPTPPVLLALPGNSITRHLIQFGGHSFPGVADGRHQSPQVKSWLGTSPESEWRCSKPRSSHGGSISNSLHPAARSFRGGVDWFCSCCISALSTIKVLHQMCSACSVLTLSCPA